MAQAFQTHRVIRSTALVAITAAFGGAFVLGGCSDDSTTPAAGAGGAGTGGSITGSGGSTSSGGASTGGSKASGGASGSGGGGGACTGGPVAGPADTHCGTTKQATGACPTDVPEPDAGPAPAGDAGPPASEYGETMVGTEADDDDCKYHIKYTVTPVCDAAGATFTVTVTTTTDGKAVTGAAAHIEAFLDDTHLSPTLDPTSTEKAGGVYEIGPVKFDKPGKWTVRFHFFENCADEPETSPHGHGAFFINVP